MRLALHSKWTCGTHDTKMSSLLLFHFILHYSPIHLPLYYTAAYGAEMFIYPTNYCAFSINRQSWLYPRWPCAGDHSGLPPFLFVSHARLRFFTCWLQHRPVDICHRSGLSADLVSLAIRAAILMMSVYFESRGHLTFLSMAKHKCCRGAGKTLMCTYR